MLQVLVEQERDHRDLDTLWSLLRLKWKNILTTSGSRTPLDFSEKSVNQVNEFIRSFARQEFKAKREYPSNTPFSLYDDISIYIAEMLFRKHENLQW